MVYFIQCIPAVAAVAEEVLEELPAHSGPDVVTKQQGYENEPAEGCRGPNAAQAATPAAEEVHELPEQSGLDAVPTAHFASTGWPTLVYMFYLFAWHTFVDRI